MRDLYAGTRIDSTGIPRAPATAFRKRPVKLEYDKNEYYTFRLPSEDAQLLAPFDKEELFGKYDGVNYSPHIKSQVELDTKLLWVIGGITILASLSIAGTSEEISALRLNYRMSNMGKFSADDFVEKN